VILVTVGSAEPFERLLLALEGLVPPEQLVVQAGASRHAPRAARVVTFLPFDELLTEMRAAVAVVMHAGAGSVLAALSCGKRPIVVPRLARFGEAVDDHQLVFGRRLHDVGLATLVEDLSELGEAIAGAGPAPVEEADGGLARELRSYIAEAVRAARASAA
jgi:beta-1,4-N-acetylglucosaminyltransferase